VFVIAHTSVLDAIGWVTGRSGILAC